MAGTALGLAVIGMGRHTGRFSTVDAWERALYDGAADPDVTVRGPARAEATAVIKASLMSLERHEGRPDQADSGVTATGLARAAASADIMAERVAGAAEEALCDGGLLAAARTGTALVVLTRPDAFVEPDAPGGPGEFGAPRAGGGVAGLLAARCGLGGPSIVLTDRPAGLAQAMDTARDWLAGAGISAVLVVAADPGGAVDPADRGGAVALLVADATTVRQRAYATIDAIAMRAGERPDGALADAVRDALRAAGTTPARVEHVVLAAPSDMDGAEPPDTKRAALLEADFEESSPIPAHAGIGELSSEFTPNRAALWRQSGGLARVWPVAVGGPRHAALALVRDTGAIGLLGAILRAALCLHHCYLPADPDGGRPGPAGPDGGGPAGLGAAGPDGGGPAGLGVAGSGLYRPWQSHPWVRASSRLARQACVVAASGGGAACLVMCGATVRGEVVANDWGRVDERVLLPVCGRDLGDLMRALARAADAVRGGLGIAALARDAAAELPGAPLRAVLCAPPASLATEIERALAGVAAAYAEGRDWASPAGSYLAARPIGPTGRVALVFPGIFSAYPGLGRDLPRSFPGILTWAESLIERPGRVFREGLLYRSAGGSTSPEELAAWESEVLADLPALATVGTLFGMFHAELARRLLGLPDSSNDRSADDGAAGYGAFGYSLGESTMTVATRRWTGGDGGDGRDGEGGRDGGDGEGGRDGRDGEGGRDGEDVARLAEIPLFRDGQAGACRVVRARWGLPETTPDAAVWGSRLLFADAGVVRARAGAFERVFVTHVNTPGEVVVAGDPAQCEALARAVGCPSIPSAYSHILHTPLTDVRPLRELLRRVVRPAAGVELLSARRYGPLGDLAAADLAADLAEVMRRPVDFPRLVRAAYVRGYRYFLEVGPGATCTRWVQDSLAGRPHLAESLDRRGISTATSAARLVARLASHGVPVDLAPFLPGRDTAIVLNPRPS